MEPTIETNTETNSPLPSALQKQHDEAPAWRRAAIETIWAAREAVYENWYTSGALFLLEAGSLRRASERRADGTPIGMLIDALIQWPEALFDDDLDLCNRPHILILDPGARDGMELLWLPAGDDPEVVQILGVNIPARNEARELADMAAHRAATAAEQA